MKFRITKRTAETILKQFDKKDTDFAEIDLELVPDTLREAEMKMSLETEAWHKGYHYGFKEGYYSAENKRPNFCHNDCNKKFSIM